VIDTLPHFRDRCSRAFPRADATILVIRSGNKASKRVRRARDILTQVNAHVAGVLLNDRDLTSPDYYYYYEYQGNTAVLPGRLSRAGDDAKPKGLT